MNPETSQPPNKDSDPFTYAPYLTETAYKDSSHLAARQAIYRFSQSQVDLIDWVLDQLGEVDTLLDVGCGNGRYLFRLGERGIGRVGIGLDLSEGMVRELKEASPEALVAVADAQRLPVSDGCLDTVLAPHMLYHVPDIPKALREFRRVLRPAGTLVAVTNSEKHLEELDVAVLGSGGGRPQPRYAHPSRSFSLENGESMLRDVFPLVERRDLNSRLLVTRVGPVLDYVATLRDWFEPLLASEWDDCMLRLAETIRTSIAERGSFEITTACGAFFCSDPTRGTAFDSVVGP